MSTADGTVLGNTQIFGGAPRNRAFNVVLLADGFTRRAAERLQHRVLRRSSLRSSARRPSTSSRPAINVFRVNVTSTDSGADDPVAGGGTGATARTYFDSTLRRQRHPPAAAVQHHDGAAGGRGAGPRVHRRARGRELDDLRRQRRRVSAPTRSPTAPPRSRIHEMGHTAFGLADEYPYYAGGNETGHDHHPAGEPSEPNVTTNTDRNTLKWRWAVASTTADPDDEQSRTARRWTRGPARCRRARSALFEGAHYYHCGAFRPEYDCKMRALSVPFCRVCRQVIWNRIGPLATLQARARTPITVVARYPEHLDVFAVASNGRTMSNWWDQSAAGPGGSTSPAASRRRAAPDRRSRPSPATPAISICSRSAPTTASTAAWWDVVQRLASSWFRIGNLQCRPGSTVNVVSRYTRSSRSVHHRLRRPRSCPRGGTRARGWAGLVPRDGRRRRQRRHRHGHRALPGPSRSCSPSARTTASTAAGGTIAAAGTRWFPLGGQLVPSELHGHRGRALPRSPRSVHDRVGRTRSCPRGGTRAAAGRTWFQVSGGVASAGSPVTAIARYSNHLDLFVIGTDNRIYSTWWHDGQRLGRLVQRLGRCRQARRSGRGHLPVHRAHRPVHGRLRRPRLQHVVGRRRRWAGWFRFGRELTE